MPVHNRDRLNTPVKKFSSDALSGLQHRLQKRGKKLKGASSRARHRVRIAAKNTRYAIEFFQSLYRSKQVRPFVDVLSMLQDELGRLNDAAVADCLLKELHDRQAHPDQSAGFIRGYLTSRIENDEKKIHRLWKKIRLMKLHG